MNISLELQVINIVGKHFVAAADVGGIRLRGKQASDPASAVRNLLWKLAGQDQDDDALLAIELVAAGTSLTGQLQQLGDGSDSKA